MVSLLCSSCSISACSSHKFWDFYSTPLVWSLRKWFGADFIKHGDSEILALLDMETSPGEIFGKVLQSLAFIKEPTWR